MRSESNPPTNITILRLFASDFGRVGNQTCQERLSLDAESVLGSTHRFVREELQAISNTIQPEEESKGRKHQEGLFAAGGKWLSLTHGSGGEKSS